MLSLVNSSLEQTHTDNIAYYLGNQYISYLEKWALWVRISFWWRFTKKNNNSQSCLVCHKAITLLKCKKKKTCINSLKFLSIALIMSTKGTTGQHQKHYNNSHNNSTVIIYSKWAKSRCAILSRGNLCKNWYIKLKYAKDTYLLDKVTNGLKLELNELPSQYSRSTYPYIENEVISAEILKLIIIIITIIRKCL